MPRQRGDLDWTRRSRLHATSRGRNDAGILAGPEMLVRHARCWAVRACYRRRRPSIDVGRTSPMWKPGIHRVLLASAVAVVVTLLLDVLWIATPSALGEHIPFSVFLFVVGGVALSGSIWPGLLAVILGAVSGLYLGEPRFVWTLHHRSDWVLFWIFLAIGSSTAFVCARLRRALEERRMALLEVERRAQEEAKRLN